MGYETSAERWSPVQSVEKILLSVVSMLAGMILIQRGKDLIGLFDALIYVPVNSYGHVGTLPSFYGTSTQHWERGRGSPLSFQD